MGLEILVLVVVALLTVLLISDRDPADLNRSHSSEAEAHPGTNVVLPTLSPAGSVDIAVGRPPMGKNDSVTDWNGNLEFTSEISALIQP